MAVIWDSTYAFEPFFDERVAVEGRRGERPLRLSVRACVLDEGAADSGDGAVAATAERAYCVRVPSSEWVDATSPRRGDAISRESGERLRVGRVERDGAVWLLFAGSKGGASLMAASVQVRASLSDGRPLSALADLIGMRMKWMRESAKDAVVATAIDALVSLRALTRRARRARKAKVVAAPGLSPSFEGGRRRPRRVLRQGGAKYAPGVRVKWLVPAGAKSRALGVFMVVPEHSAVRSYLVVAPSAERAAEFEGRAAALRIRAYGGLAKWALGAAMRGLSTRNGAAPDVSPEAEGAGARLSSVQRFAGAGGAYAVRVADAARHAVAALRGGEGAVDAALMKAANKIAGRLLHRFGDALGPDFSTPFPEVRRRR